MEGIAIGLFICILAYVTLNVAADMWFGYKERQLDKRREENDRERKGLEAERLARKYAQEDATERKSYVPPNG
jgi:hypothetical protein